MILSNPPKIIIKTVTTKKLKVTDLTAEETYKLEIQSLKRLKREPFFPNVLETNDEALQITMSYAGASINRLAKKFPNGYVINKEQYALLNNQINLITSALERRDVVHLDLRASNICVTKNYELKLIDFGLAVIDKKPYKEKLKTQYNNFLQDGGYNNFSKVLYDIVFETFIPPTSSNLQYD
jgi:tRNA A-37 threonylcarbamoyl transferase component Bud32